MQPATRKHADASRPDDLWPDDLWEFKMTAAAARMAALRAAVKTAGLDGWYVGREDMFQGEEVPEIGRASCRERV